MGAVRALNPMGYPPDVQQVQMAPRMGTLRGKTVYLVDARFDDSDIFMQQMEAWFRDNRPDINAVYVAKRGIYTQPDPELFARIRDEGAAAVVGVGH
jgi:hypothetical protein